MDSNQLSPSPGPPTSGPQLSRGRPLYPVHLSRSETNGQEVKRVPLHRRGKSHTYERLEDLLREAGYAETRIFTPEAERLEAQAERRVRGRPLRGDNLTTSIGSDKLGGVMSFLAGLVGGGVWRTGGVGAESDNKEGHDGSKPTETMSWGRAQGRSITSSFQRRDSQNIEPPSPSPKTRGRLDSHPSTGHRLTPVIIATPPLNSPDSGLNSSESNSTSFYSANQYANASSASLSPPLPSATPSYRHPPMSRATAALRHMISTPNIPKRDRPRSSYAQLPSATRRSSEAVVSTTYRYSTANVNAEPPLPSNWLQTVAQAVLGIGPESGAYIGGPRGRPQYGGLNNRRDISTSGATSRGLPPRTYTPKPATGLVTLASVTCHSAPGSRSSSRVRTPGRGGNLSRKDSMTNRKRQHSPTRVPTLGVTTVDMDIYEGSANLLSSVHTGQNIPLGNETDLTDDDDDADPEPDFSALLMPARRQNSIRSLRRHLHHCQQNGEGHTLGRASSVASFRGNSSSRVNNDKTRQGESVRGRRGNTNSAASSIRRTLHSQSCTENGGSETRLSSRRTSAIGGLDPDDSFEAFLAQNLLRSRRGSIDEGGGLADWPGLLRTSFSQRKKKERGAMPAAWMPWAQR